MLVLARHGQSEANAHQLIVGRADPPLTELGVRQARALAATEALRGASVVIASPLRRARQTAAALGLPVEVDDRWIEMDYGALDGRPGADVWLPRWDRWRADPEEAPPGGESLAAVSRRVGAACEELRERAATEDVVVITHVSPVKAAVAWALGVGDGVAWRMLLELASVTRIAVGGHRPVLASYNETQHLVVPPGPAGAGSDLRAATPGVPGTGGRAG